MNSYNDSKKIKIVFFSGTGSTANVANVLQKSLETHGKTVIMHELNSRNSVTIDNKEGRLIILEVTKNY